MLRHCCWRHKKLSKYSHTGVPAGVALCTAGLLHSPGSIPVTLEGEFRWRFYLAFSTGPLQQEGAIAAQEPTCWKEAAPDSSWLLCLLSQRGQSSYLIPLWTWWSITSGSLDGLNKGEKDPTKEKNVHPWVHPTSSAPVEQLRCSPTKPFSEVLLYQFTTILMVVVEDTFLHDSMGAFETCSCFTHPPWYYTLFLFSILAKQLKLFCLWMKLILN